MREKEKLSPVDAAWLRLDEDVNTADIVGVLVLSERMDVERVREIVAAHFGAFPEFTRRIVDSGGLHAPYWEDVELAMDHHVEAVTLPAGNELRDFVTTVLTMSLPRDRPLWKMYVVDVDQGSALVVKIHHCLGDGFAMVGVLLALCDDAPIPAPHEAGGTAKASLGAQLWGGVVDVAQHPEQLLEAAKLSARMAESLGELLMLSFDTETSLRAKLTGVRHAAWSRGIDLQRFKALATATGGTINDVLLSVLSGALRAVMLDAGDQLDEASIRAIVPVNLRPLDRVGRELGNKFGLVFLDMPVDEADPTARRERVRASMNHLKQSPQAVVGFGILSALGLGPGVVEHLASDIFTRKGSLVVTNVPGPRERLRLDGVEIDHVMFWVPHPALLGLGVSLLSYAGEVRIGVRADAAVMKDPQALVDAFEAELEGLEA